MIHTWSSSPHPKTDFFCPLLLKGVCCLFFTGHGEKKYYGYAYMPFGEGQAGQLSRKFRQSKRPQKKEGSQAADRLGTIFSLLAVSKWLKELEVLCCLLLRFLYFIAMQNMDIIHINVEWWWHMYIYIYIRIYTLYTHSVMLNTSVSSNILSFCHFFMVK